MLVDDRLDLGRVDVDAARDDHVLLAVADVEVALVVEVGDVADRLPVASPCSASRSSVLVVAVHRERRADEQLAGLPRPARRCRRRGRSVPRSAPYVRAARSRACGAGPRGGARSRRRARSSRRPRRGSRRRASRSPPASACTGTGAALAIRVRIDERSARASSPGGRLTMRFSWVGAQKVSVTRCSLTRRNQDDGSNLRSTMIVPPTACANGRERQRTRVVQRAGGEVHRGRRRAGRAVRAARRRSRRRSWCGARPWAARWCPTCRSSSRRWRRRRSARRRSRAAVSGCSARCSSNAMQPSGTAPPNTRTARTFGRRSRTDATSGACSASTTTTVGVGVVDDVAHLLGGETVRHRDRGEPALRPAWSVAITSSELGPHHAMRSPGAAPSA